MRTISCLILFTFLLQIILLGACNDVKQDPIPEILQQLVKENEIPGLNFSIIYNDGTQKNYSSGLANLKTREKLNTDHVMFSGSVGKTYAVAVLMQLVEENRVDLKALFLDYFPDHEWLNKLPNIEDITVEMLLQHTSGLPRYINHQEVWDALKNNPDRVWTYHDRLSYIFNDEPVHKVGKGWAYSDTNYILIGMLIEKITGSAYYDEVKERILTLENFANTYPSIKRAIKNLPTGYSKLDSFFRMPEIVVEDGVYVFNPQMEWTGGGMALTTSDLAKWAEIYFEAKAFSKEMLGKITTVNSNGKDVIGKGSSYGMGCFIYETELGIAHGHTGFVPGFVSIFAYYPKQKLAVALQVNCDYAAKEMSLVDYLDRILAHLK